LLWREHPPLNVHIPISDLTDVVIANQTHNSTFYSFGRSHSYGGGFSGPRMYMGQSTGQAVGTIQMYIGNRMVMSWSGIADPQGVKNILMHQIRQSR